MCAYGVLKIQVDGLLSIFYMDESSNNGVMEGFQHYDRSLVVFRLSK